MLRFIVRQVDMINVINNSGQPLETMTSFDGDDIAPLEAYLRYSDLQYPIYITRHLVGVEMVPPHEVLR